MLIKLQDPDFGMPMYVESNQIVSIGIKPSNSTEDTWIPTIFLTNGHRIELDEYDSTRARLVLDLVYHQLTD
jgi:hypothetical protein